MARYIDCDKCYHRYACAGDTDKWNYYGECPHYTNSADVVPRSEVEKAEQEVASEIIEHFVNKKKEFRKFKYHQDQDDFWMRTLGFFRPHR